jgi:hypothetical protein
MKSTQDILANFDRRVRLAVAREMRRQGWRLTSSWARSDRGKHDFVFGAFGFFPLRPGIVHAVQDAVDAINTRRRQGAYK